MAGFVVAVVLLVLLVALALAAPALRIAVVALRWRNNRRSPVLTEPATVVTKRQETLGRRNAHVSTEYFVTFQVRGGVRLELPVDGPEYGVLVAGDRGDLTHQGSWFRGFARVPQDV